MQPFMSVPKTVYVCVDDGVNGTLLEIPLTHVYVLAPIPVKVTVEPKQTEVADAFTVIVGREFTVIVFVAVFVQPFISVPVTV